MLEKCGVDGFKFGWVRVGFGFGLGFAQPDPNPISDSNSNSDSDPYTEPYADPDSDPVCPSLRSLLEPSYTNKQTNICTIFIWIDKENIKSLFPSQYLTKKSETWRKKYSDH